MNRPNEQGGGFVVYSDAWQELQPAVLYLERQYRQNDEQLLEILTALRTGDVRRRHVEALLARTEIEPPDGDITELHTVNVDVDDINIQKIGGIARRRAFVSADDDGLEDLCRESAKVSFGSRKSGD